MLEVAKWFAFGFVLGYVGSVAPKIIRAILANRALRKRLGLAMIPELLETRQMRRQASRGFARGAFKLAKEMARQEKLPWRERLRLWFKNRTPTFYSLYRRATESRNAKPGVKNNEKISRGNHPVRGRGGP